MIAQIKDIRAFHAESLLHGTIPSALPDSRAYFTFMIAHQACFRINFQVAVHCFEKAGFIGEGNNNIEYFLPALVVLPVRVQGIIQQRPGKIVI